MPGGGAHVPALGVVAVAEERLEGGVLREVVLDLADALAGPPLDPVLGEAVGDQINAVVAHGRNDRKRRRDGIGPIGLFGDRRR